ncbi:hypothetical protein GCM10023219_14560 [Stakelama sediminis]|uniref:Uncharacterized protein n=1 Tax=Stakelama sediminis TaxID=463200 RepID=A0A840YWS9_9SPHN|nr:hypothetical protein [Stakelama sediminis]MBB5718181.1 hypothetical protein [Stakelama sediminis]
MATEVDRQIARSSEVLDRSRERYASLRDRARKRRGDAVLHRLGRIAAADIAIIIAALVIGWIVPLGMGGALAVMAALIAATLLFAIFPLSPEVTAEKLTQAPLKALPLQTEQWLERQRPALPAPAQLLADSIGVKLETLTPQLATLDENQPAAAEVRKLVGEQLPELVKGYARVPEPLRRVERNGRTPDQQLVDGLKVIDEEIGQMSSQLAQGDLDLLATRGRYLQIRYKEEDTLGGE